MTTFLPAHSLGSPDAPGEWFHGFGLVKSTGGSVSMVGHGGMYGGHGSGLWRFPECGDLTVVTYINRGLIAADSILRPLASALGCPEA